MNYLSSEKGFSAILVVLALVVIAAIAGGTYYLGLQKGQQNSQTNQTGTSASSSANHSLATPSPSSIPSPTPDNTATWKTYSNTEYGLSVKYPPNYNVTKLNPANTTTLLEMEIKNPNPKPGGGYSQPNVRVVVYQNDANDINGWVNKHTTNLPFDDPSVSQSNSPYFFRGVTDKTNSSISGKSAISFKATGMETAPNPTLTSVGKYIIGLVFDNVNEIKDPDLKNLYSSILSSFKFTNN